MNKYKTKHYEIIDREEKISDEIIRICSFAYDKNKRFFGKDSGFFKIYITHTEEEFRKRAKPYYKPWVKGISRHGRFVVIRDPKLFNECYKKHKGTKDYRILLAHEVNHVFAWYFNMYRGPYWMTEGLATYVAGQIPGKTYKRDIKINRERAIEQLFYRGIKRKMNMDMYVVDYYGIEHLIRIHGKGRFQKLIKSYTEKTMKKDFEKTFNKIYRISYNNFLKNFLDNKYPN